MVYKNLNSLCNAFKLSTRISTLFSTHLIPFAIGTHSNDPCTLTISFTIRQTSRISKVTQSRVSDRVSQTHASLCAYYVTIYLLGDCDDHVSSCSRYLTLLWALIPK